MTFQIGPTSGEVIKVTGQPMTVFGIDAAIRGIKLSAADYTNNATFKSFVDGLKDGSGTSQYFTYDAETKSIKLKPTDPTSGEKWSSMQAKGTTAANTAYAELGLATPTGEYTFLLGMNVGLTTTNKSNEAIDTINAAINAVSSYRAKLGAAQNRLEHTINNLEVTSENITSAESRIRDTDMADEITAFTKNNILLQASQSMLR